MSTSKKENPPADCFQVTDYVARLQAGELQTPQDKLAAAKQPAKARRARKAKAEPAVAAPDPIEQLFTGAAGDQGAPLDDLDGSVAPPPPPVDGGGKGGEGDWMSGGRPDPIPLTVLGHKAGVYYFIGPFGEYKALDHRALFGRGGISMLFDGQISWLVRHYASLDREGNPTGRFRTDAAAEMLIRLCVKKGMFDAGRVSVRGPGVWRGPQHSLIVHVGDAVRHELPPKSHNWQPPGLMIGGALYAAAPRIVRPATDASGTWAPADAEVGKALAESYGLWHFERGEPAQHLACGWVGMAMLGNAQEWRAHVFATGPRGCGKTALAEFQAAVLGDAGNKPGKNYTEAFLRQALTGEARGLVLDETESDAHQGRVMALIELIRHMSDGDGARIGRGSAGGKAQVQEITGATWLSAILVEALTPQDASRITQFYLRPLRPEASKSALLQATAAMAEHSPALRARMIALVGLYRQNFAAWRDALLARKADARQADQLASMLAGYDTLCSDEVVDAARLAEVDRYLPFLVDDDPAVDSDGIKALNRLFSTSADLWRSGERRTVGQLIAAARENSAVAERRALSVMGVRLVDHPAGNVSHWGDAWLAIANQHEAMTRIYADTPWRNGKWSQVLKTLEGAEITEAPIWVGGSKTRARLIPPRYLPSAKDLQLNGDDPGAPPEEGL